MSARAFLNRRPAVTVGVVAVLTALAVAFIVYQLRPESEGPPVRLKDFYTVDDGETWFADDVNKVTPFDHGGKPAVLIRLFTCDGGKTRFVGYLEKLPDGAVDAYRSRMHVSAGDVPEADEVAQVVGSLVKRKGDAQWVPSSDGERFGQIKGVRCPDGKGDLEVVRPRGDE